MDVNYTVRMSFQNPHRLPPEYSSYAILHLKWAPALCEDQPCCLLWILRVLDDHRDSYPSDRIFCPPSFAACSHLLKVADPLNINQRNINDKSLHEWYKELANQKIVNPWQKVIKLERQLVNTCCASPILEGIYIFTTHFFCTFVRNIGAFDWWEICLLNFKHPRITQALLR